MPTMDHKLHGRRASSKLPNLIDLVLYDPGHLKMTALLKVSRQGALDVIGAFGLRELALGIFESHSDLFNGRLRDELLNETLLTSLAQARAATAMWRADYNTARPHPRSPGRTPDEFASTFTPASSAATALTKAVLARSRVSV